MSPTVPPNASTSFDLPEALAQLWLPTLVLHNRLEGLPRADNFDRALRAEVHDALWMLARQWQFGEFHGEDAGSPVLARVQSMTTRLQTYQPRNGPEETLPVEVPLEACVERRPLPMRVAQTDVGLDIRLLMGRQWCKMVGHLGNFEAALAVKYPITLPDPTRPEHATICADPEVWGAFVAVAGRRMDGMKLYVDLMVKDHHAYEGIAGLESHKEEVQAIESEFRAWFDRLLLQPPSSAESWDPQRLEYQFAFSGPWAGQDKVLMAEEYYHGHLDWYNFEVERGAKSSAAPCQGSGLPACQTQNMLPEPVTFDGMPSPRWWSFEDRRTNFGEVKPEVTGLAHLMFLEFGLVYANDYFLIPITYDTEGYGVIANLEGVVITNVFGDRTWVRPAGSGQDDDWQRWAVFVLNTRGTQSEPADTSLVLPPAASKILQGPALEDVLLIRDELANMVWGLEQTITLPSGEAKPGSEAARDLLAFLTLPPQHADPSTPKIRYQLMNTVPENWIPFIPVHVENSNRQIQLQRASMPRVVGGATEKVGPRTTLLRAGLDSVGNSTGRVSPPYYIHEEEVPRAGVRLIQGFRRTRTSDGRLWVWLGIRKHVGRGETSSGLAFDQLVPTE